MAPKTTNTKKEAGRAKKADNEAKKRNDAAAEKERKEAEAWSQGAKSTKGKADKDERRRAELARKAENARLLEEEEKTMPPKPKATPKAAAKKAAKPAVATTTTTEGEPESFAATGIDSALDLLEVVTAKTDKASVGQQAATIERHPERRFKAAFEAYKESELPQLKVDHPGLRMQQYNDLLYKQFQKSPDNPFNQVTVAYDATKGQRVEALQEKQQQVQDRLRT